MASIPNEPAAGVWLSEPKQGSSRFSEALHVNGMADPVARPAVPDAELFARAKQKQVVVGILEIRLQQIVIDVLGRHLGLGPGNLHGLKLQHHHGSGGILGQGLIDAQSNFLPRRHFPVHQVSLDQLLGNVLFHGDILESTNPCGLISGHFKRTSVIRIDATRFHSACVGFFSFRLRTGRVRRRVGSFSGKHVYQSLSDLMMFMISSAV